MAHLLYTVIGITNVASVHCAARPEISPCTCEPIFTSHNYLELNCEKVDSFHRIVDALSNKFNAQQNISLKISYSQLDDLEMLSFRDMKLNIVKLRMNWDNLTSMPEMPFRGLNNINYMSIGDNALEEVPKNMLKHMPHVQTLDLGRCRIMSVLHDDFKHNEEITSLFLTTNQITRLDRDVFPKTVTTLHLGRNKIEQLNGTLRKLDNLESLFINSNNIASLDNELPTSNQMKLIIAQSNRLQRLPEDMRHMIRLDTLNVHYNNLKALDGILRSAINLKELKAFNNEIEYLAKDEFQHCQQLEDLDIFNNRIRLLNSSLLPLTHIAKANFSHNLIEEFSMEEIRGLTNLLSLDLSNNRIEKLTGRQQNSIEQYSALITFNLDHNLLKSLDGALVGLNSLRILSLSFNQIEKILPEDFIGLVKLEILDLSHNQIMTLKEMGTTVLPSLKILKVAYNKLTVLEKDFHGLPVLCQANLTNNHISSISTELVSQTKCMNYNVPGKLELYLDDNPIMCDDRLNELCIYMTTQHARIRGHSSCFDIDQEVCTVLPRLYTPIINLTYVIQQQLSKPILPSSNKPVVVLPSTQSAASSILILNSKPEELPPIIQPLIMPATTSTTTTTTTTSTTSTTTPMPIGTTGSANEMALNNHHHLNVAEIQNYDDNSLSLSSQIASNMDNATTTSTTSLPPLLSTMLHGHTIAEKPQATPTTLLNAEIEAHSQLATNANNDDAKQPLITESAAPKAQQIEHEQQMEYTTIKYIPNLERLVPAATLSVDRLDEEDSNSNSVHAEYHQSAVQSNLDDAPQNYVIHKEPPENS